jgi:flagellar basal-body rod protein FlgB
MNISQALTNRMDFLIARQGVIAGNIANADTPGYASADVQMKPQGAPATTPFSMALTSAAHQMGGGAGGVNAKHNTSYRFIQHNGNAVRLDEQMLLQSQNSLNYRLMTQIYSKNVQLQKMALGRQ